MKQVTSIRTICDAMKAHANRSLLSEVHRLYLSIPTMSSTSERSFSAMKRLFTYIRSTMTEKRSNNCFLLHIHKVLTDTINLVDVAKEFILANDERKHYFVVFVEK